MHTGDGIWSNGQGLGDRGYSKFIYRWIMANSAKEAKKQIEQTRKLLAQTKDLLKQSQKLVRQMQNIIDKTSKPHSK